MIIQGKINIREIPIKANVDPSEVERFIRYAAKVWGLYEGEKGTYLDFSVSERKEPDKLENTHSISVWDKDTKEKTYIGSGKAKEFKQAEQPNKRAEQPSGDGLPF